MLKAVIFDMDDTLIDWEARELDDWRAFERDHLRDVYAYLVGEGHDLPDEETFVETASRITEDSWSGVDEDLRAPHLGQTLIAAAVELGVPRDRLNMQALLHAYGWTGMPGVEPFPEVPAMLERLRGHGLKLGLVTNAYAPMWMREQELRALNLSPDLFDCRVSSADLGFLKPHPAIFTHALDCLDVTAEEAIFIGDNPAADVVGAQGVGMRAVWRTRREMPPLPASMIAPDATLTSLEQLPGVLDKYFPGWDDHAA